ncbi:MAG: glycoside hydrolase family 43, partial [Gemmatimonadetes bacterium]|nr:glycoside hydrolase family 43 [Gemmatimonadota bacterium]
SWTQIGNVLDRRSQLDLDSAGISRGIYAPTIRYHDGLYYMITTIVDRGGNFIVTATNPAGPWSDPIWLKSVDGIDPSIFFDDDGKAYVMNNGEAIETPRYEGHRAIWIQEFDVAGQKMVGPRKLIVNGGVDISTKPIWIEAPHVFKRGRFYYLICAEGGTGDQHSEVVFRSDAPMGPYVPFSGNPILTQRQLDRSDRNRAFPVTSTGHADFVETQAGEWWAVFLGTRPYANDTYNTGRETFMLPVTWMNDWPVVLAGDARVGYVNKRPNLPRQPTPAVALNGNFTYRDDFTSDKLAPGWVTIRHPAGAWADLASLPGTLTLHGRSAGFEPAAQPAFIAHRQQHLSFSASTSMTYEPINNGDKAGLVAFQNDEFYYFLSVAKVNGESVVQLEKRAGRGRPVVVATASVPVTSSAPVYLEIVGNGGTYDFYYATSPNDWKALSRGADGSVLSTKVAGGFVGTMIGLYAYRSPGAK